MNTHSVAATCFALGEPTRWTILEILGRGDASASALARQLPISRQAITRHLSVLTEVGLVTTRRSGREVVYRVHAAELSHLANALEKVGNEWDSRLSALKDLAEDL